MRLRRRLPLPAGWAEFDQTDMVRIADRAVPRRIEVTFPSTADKWPSAHFVIEVRAGVPVCTEVTVRAHEEGREVRRADLDAVALEEWVENIVAEASSRLYDGDGEASFIVDGPLEEPEFREAREVVRYARKGARRTVTDDVLRQVADIYRDHITGNPVEAVQRAFQTSHRTATRYVARAREAGFLPPTSQGRKHA